MSEMAHLAQILAFGALRAEGERLPLARIFYEACYSVLQKSVAKSRVLENAIAGCTILGAVTARF
jgi:hypothetical protein